MPEMSRTAVRPRRPAIRAAIPAWSNLKCPNRRPAAVPASILCPIIPQTDVADRRHVIAASGFAICPAVSRDLPAPCAGRRVTAGRQFEGRKGTVCET